MAISLPKPAHVVDHDYVTCRTGHWTHHFLACDEQSACWTNQMTSCSAPLTPQPPTFLCSNGHQHVSYMMVCDHLANCRDRSDEEFCVFRPCLTTQFRCDTGQCIPLNQQCDHVHHCADHSDEGQCDIQNIYLKIDEVYPPAVVDFDGLGSYKFRPLVKGPDGEMPPCPETHFRCPGDGYCLPVFVICNNVHDCPGHEDEAGCENYECPGLYRCRSSRVCLHSAHICDNEHQCPERDDELNCNAVCPQGCTCYGMIFFCHNTLAAELYPDLRYLDASNSQTGFIDIMNNTMLVYLSLARCGLSQIYPVNLLNMHTLDLTGNRIQSIDGSFFYNLQNLRELSLSGNPLVKVSKPAGWSLLTLRTLHLVQSHMSQSILNVMGMFPNMYQLNLSDNGIESLTGEEFRALEYLQVLDLRGNPVTFFPKDVFKGLKSLTIIFADNYKLCCPALLPSRFSPNNCRAPSNEISSCEEMLRSSVYRGFLSLFAFFSVMGNVVSFLYRLLARRHKKINGYDVFVANLCVSDFLMGTYLSVIGVADLVYRGNYLSKDVTWRYSTFCKAAGFLSLLSNEVSVFIICLITLDRFLVLNFSFSQVHFSQKRALLAASCVWLVGLLLATIPLLPWTSHWQFYSQNSICIPLPITRKEYPGHFYSFGIMIIFNFVLFMVIALGQFSIYWSVRRNSMRSSIHNSSSARDINIAQRLIAVALSDFLCWFPIGLLGLLANSGQPISGEVNVAIAIFVLPINSAINPFLYTINIILENRRKQKEERLKQMLRLQVLEEIRSTNSNRHQGLNNEESMQLLKLLLKKGTLSRENMSGFIVDNQPDNIRFTQDQSLILIKHLISKDLLPTDQAVEYIMADTQAVPTHAVNHDTDRNQFT